VAATGTGEACHGKGLDVINGGYHRLSLYHICGRCATQET
jgi:hypothetical protein